MNPHPDRQPGDPAAGRGRLHVYPDPGRLAEAAAELVAERAAQAVAARGRFTVALAGGRTPEPVYRKLAEPAMAARIDWPKVWVYFGDERCVPPGDSRSNYRMAREALLDQVDVPAVQVRRIRGEDDPASAAAAYERELRRDLGVRTPGLDLVLLGLGADGHTASLFPGSAAVREPARWVLAQFAGAAAGWRITLTPVLLNSAVTSVFLVSGADKAGVLRRVLEGPRRPEALPAQAIRPASGDLRWLVDAAAAARLEGRS